MATKHVPIRTCIATGEKHPKNQMIRLVRLENGDVVVDPKGKEKGRGANLLMSEAVFDLALKKKAIQRALKLDKPLSSDDIARLRSEFLQAIALKSFRKGNQPVTIKIAKEELTKIEAES